MYIRRSALTFGLVLLAAGCGPAVTTPTTSAPDPITPPVAVTPSAAPIVDLPVQAGPFENPGGMWTPEQIKDHAAQLRALGLEIDPAQLSSPTSPLLQSVISLGGCSASFVSPEGLIATNHHCATGTLQRNSTPKQNLLTNGYLAKTRADERSNGPAARVFVTEALRDVTAQVREGLEKIPDDLARYKKIEERQKQIVAACEKGRKGVRCSVGSYFGGAQYTLVEQLEIRDVRLVYAPSEGIGNFGGEIDNWRWPRHGGDFAMFRAYVGPDGKPADFAKENVPYKPPHHLKLASKPLREGDLVIVAGYPSQTNRLRNAAEVEEATSWLYPRRIKVCEEYIALAQQIGKQSPALQIKVRTTERSLGNAMTKYRGIQDGLLKGGLADKKKKLDADLKAFVEADAGRKATYGDVLPKLTAIKAEQAKTREQEAAQREAFTMTKLLGAAATIVRMAEEREKPDAERNPGFQERNWPRLEQAQVALQVSYDRKIDPAMLGLALQRAARLPEKDQPPILAAVRGKGTTSAADLDKAIAALYAKTKLESADARVKLLKTATTASLKESGDPLILLALEMRPVEKALDDREEAFAGALAMLRPRYVEALRKLTAGRLAPDANGTLRITYGTVRGYRPEPQAPMFTPFTRVSEVVKKHKGEHPFIVPETLQAASKAGKFGPYVDEKLGEVPVDFLSDLDITGGNSGSATLNSRGEIVGLAFDGNYEAMGSDWLFMPSVTRTIHVDIRYLLWVMDAVDGADHLLKEMGTTPAVN